MIKKIAFSLIFLCLLIAIPLAMLGYERVELGAPALALIRVTSRDLSNFSFKIPDIPPINLFETPQGFEIVLNFLIKVVNGLSTLINVVISLLNVVIEVLEFIVLLVRNLIQFKNNVQPYIPQT